MVKDVLGPLTAQSSISSPGAAVAHTRKKIVQEEQIEQISSEHQEGDHQQQQQSPTLWRIEFRGVSKLVRWASLKRPPPLSLPTATTDTIAASSQLPLDTTTDASRTNPSSSSTPSTSSSLMTSRSSSFVSYSSRKLRRRVTEETTPTLSRSHSVHHDNTSTSQDRNDEDNIPPVPQLPSGFAPAEIHHSTNTNTSRTASSSSSSFTSRIARSLSMSSSSAAANASASSRTARTRTRPAPAASSAEDTNSNMIATKHVSTTITPRASALGADAVQNQTNANGETNGIVSFRGAAAGSAMSSHNTYGAWLSVCCVLSCVSSARVSVCVCVLVPK